MNIQSHLLMAMEMEKHIKEKYRLELRWNLFYYGNIRPDLTPRGEKKAPHTFKDSLPVFMRHCNYLSNRSQLTRPALSLMSFRLGLLLHYTADFFTYSHHDEALFGQTMAHFKYENVLLETLWKESRRDPLLPSPVGKRLDAFMFEVLKQYDQGPHSPARDADYIFQVSQVVCDRIIERIYLEKAFRESRLKKYAVQVRHMHPFQTIKEGVTRHAP